MFETFAVIQIIICLLLVVVILLQEGKKGMGAIFGGSSSSIFGARGAGNILTKVTSVLAILFMLNSVWMSYISSRDASVIDEIKTTEENKEPAMEPAPVKEEKVEEPVKEEAPANKEEAPANKEEAPAE
ncbi:MAG TPA: preprotein translocase subunit SecG [bacterium]|nr:preprotein translocase subunit SecG [bacterium]MDX9806387.1 preprotein translocase subunit SecG [bacterium]HNZ53596.1 preprotein translocase subunit SecG [bacterium]HOG44049.1 preprotein translocase subunit SecG [bacterium]HPV20359.1 preprotein translocase subunit SecG [bacterium]